MAGSVQMEREGKTADVHPDEVGNYARHGWIATAKPAPKKKTAAKAKPTETADDSQSKPDAE